MSTPLVSVIIPTHERSCYAVPTIRSILALGDEVEVVVCDTSAEDLISPELLDDPNFYRLKLLRPGKKLSVVDNFNTALGAATGKFLTFIGDDDFISEKILDIAIWAEAKKIDSIKFSFPSLYFWPDFRHKKHEDAIAGTLRISPFSGKVTPHDAKEAAFQALANFGGGVMNMPRAYAGIISMELAMRIQKKYGALFGGVSPDIYSAFLISQETRNCVHVDYPIIVPGASGASTAGQSAQGRHLGALRDNPHIRPFHDLVWDERIPEFYSVPTVWSYSLLKAVEKKGQFLNYLNFARLYIKCLVYHRKFSAETQKAIKVHIKQVNLGKFFFSLHKAILLESIWVTKKLVSRFFQKIKMCQTEKLITNLDNTHSASVGHQIYIAQHPTKLELN